MRLKSVTRYGDKPQVNDGKRREVLDVEVMLKKNERNIRVSRGVMERTGEGYR